MQAESFICSVFGCKSMYGLQPETLDSLILDFLPPLSFTYKDMKLEDENKMHGTCAEDVRAYIYQKVINALRNTGFHIPKVR